MFRQLRFHVGSWLIHNNRRKLPRLKSDAKIWFSQFYRELNVSVLLRRRSACDIVDLLETSL